MIPNDLPVKAPRRIAHERQYAQRNDPPFQSLQPTTLYMCVCSQPFLPAPAIQMHQFQSLPLFVVPGKIPQPIPMVTLRINVVHTTPQTGLQILRVVLEQPHHHSPTNTRKNRPSIVTHLARKRFPRHDRQRKRTALPHRQLGQCQHHARKDINDNLLIDARDLARAGTPAKNQVAAQQARDERVVGPFLGFAARGDGVGAVVFEEEAGELVDCCEFGEVAGVGARCAEDEPEFLSEPVVENAGVLVPFSFF